MFRMNRSAFRVSEICSAQFPAGVQNGRQLVRSATPCAAMMTCHMAPAATLSPSAGFGVYTIAFGISRRDGFLFRVIDECSIRARDDDIRFPVPTSSIDIAHESRQHLAASQRFFRPRRSIQIAIWPSRLSRTAPAPSLRIIPRAACERLDRRLMPQVAAICDRHRRAANRLPPRRPQDNGRALRLPSDPPPFAAPESRPRRRRPKCNSRR